MSLRSLSAEHAHLEHFLEDMVAILPVCLTSFRNLLAIGIRGPAIDSVDMSDAVRLALRTLASDLLRYVPMLNLQELTLALPLTYDFSAIIRRAMTTEDTPLRIPLHTAMAPLRHVDLTVYDSHDKDPISGRVPPSTSRATPRAAAQLRPPNYAYAAQFFRLAHLPARLESLRISCTHFLDMDHLDICLLMHLRSLDLRHVKVSSTKLLSILSACAATLHGIVFEGVELKSGTWRDIFLALCKLDGLVVVHVMDRCTYAWDGVSAQWAPRDSRRRRRRQEKKGQQPKELLTTFYLDEPALGNLQRWFLANRLREGMQPIDDISVRYLNWEPLQVL